MNRHYYLAVPTDSNKFPLQAVREFDSRDDLMNHLGRSDPEEFPYSDYYLCVAVLSKKITVGKYIPRTVIETKSTPLSELLTNGKGNYPPAVLEFGRKLKSSFQQVA